MNYKAIKKELFFVRKAFFEYGRGFDYLLNKYRLAPRILKLNRILERPMNNKSLAMHVLSCHKDLVILVWSLASFYINSSVIGQLYIHDDGTFIAPDKIVLKRMFPSAIIVSPTEALQKVVSALPDTSIILRQRQNLSAPHFLKKLIDPYFISDVPLRLILDSDLLWFVDPLEIKVAILSGGRESLMMKNNGFCYVYDKDGGKIEDNYAAFNSGVVFYARKNYLLEKLSEYFQKYDPLDKKNAHFIEQAGYAYILQNLRSLNEELYHIKNSVSNSTVLRHYTSPRRPLFYTEGLPRVNQLLRLS